jgi:hypothetical protein
LHIAKTLVLTLGHEFAASAESLTLEEMANIVNASRRNTEPASIIFPLGWMTWISILRRARVGFGRRRASRFGPKTPYRFASDGATPFINELFMRGTHPCLSHA